ALVANFFTVIWQRRQGMHVPLDHACLAKDFVTYGIAENVRMQSLPQAWSFRKLENTIVINNACADIASLEGTDPDPPTPSEQVSGGPFTAGLNTCGGFGTAFSPRVAVPLRD